MKLKEYSSKKRISFAMPGHKGGKGISYEFGKKIAEYDVTELHDTENLYMPGSALSKAKKLASEFFGSTETYFLVNGSTSGIYSMIAAVCSPGDTIIVNRACHISVINACIMLGVKPIFFSQSIIDGYCIPGGIDQKLLVATLDRHQSAKAVLLTSPSYYGIVSDIEVISKITRARGIPLLVDEAHGAHFPVSEGIFPKSAINQGADMSVCSAHKTLNAFNQSAFLNLNSDIIDKSKLESVMAMLQTSSPSYVIAASADLARAEITTRLGRMQWREVYERCENMREKISANTDIMFVSQRMNLTNNIFGVDETRIVMNFSNYDVSGFEVRNILRKKYNIDMEMADLFNVVGIATPSNSKFDFLKLASAAVKICAELEKSDEEPFFPDVLIPEMAMSPQKAFYSPGRNVSLEESIDCVSRSTVVAYPPAVPIICAGERIAPESVGYITALQSMHAEIIGLNANGFISIVDE
ncbi:MAG: aminotransferase class I/II-fold pyridoxal phosphate-dependent enzyme [Oscillospiraceae bacterium]|nr:aminotransferase class I/II-fold pyridoxal phosphate-dependent enzyme [Oscillospiraceae bacterium]